ncbi:hypothetical protein BVG19_g689 [[Candida] boidinii]|nr:hypothetical protein BVG19_g689 [[Candida] boidinii]OWB49303.1 hypothetical protein B5S27_g843 [[Candida] boidinii]
MTEGSSFHFHLLRISIAQLLKSHGFNASNNRTLDIVTDLYVKYLALLCEDIKKFKLVRNLEDDEDLTIQDIAEAFVDMKIITPAKKLDFFDMHPLTNKGLENLEKWFQSESLERARETARPNKEFLEERNKIITENKLKKESNNTKMNNLTAVINKQQLTTDTSASSTSHHNLQPNKSLNMLPMTSISSPAPNGNTLDKDQVKGTNEPINGKTGETYDPELQGEKDEKNEKDEPIIVDEDWIKCVLRRQLNETETSFKGTIFIDNLPQNTRQVKRQKLNHDFLILGDTPDKLIEHLPYIKSDDESDSEFYNSEVELDDDNGNDNVNKDIASNDSKGQPNEENIEEGEHSIANSENYEGAAVTQNNIHNNGMDADVEIDDNSEFKPKDIHDQFDYYEHDDLLGDSGGLNLFDEPEIHTDNNLNMFG